MDVARMGALLSCVPQTASSGSPSSSAWSTTLPRQGPGNTQALSFAAPQFISAQNTTMGEGGVASSSRVSGLPERHHDEQSQICCIGSGSGKGLGHSLDVKIPSRLANPRPENCAKDALSGAPLEGEGAVCPLASLPQGGASADARRPRGRGSAQRRRARRAATAM